SISVINRFTWKQWSVQLARQAKALDAVLEEAIANPRLVESLKELAANAGERDPGRYVPYFHFAKRLLRRTPQLWEEAERLEADVRFAAGLFMPFILLAIDGILGGLFHGLLTPAAWILLFAGTIGAILVLRALPSRRTREILYDQFLALCVLKYPTPPCVDAK